jgi:hypothetical protein
MITANYGCRTSVAIVDIDVLHRTLRVLDERELA